MKTKACTKCGEEKPLEEFSIRRSRGKGRYAYCKKCGQVAAAEWKKKNKEKVRENQKSYRQANKEKLKAQAKEYREANKEKIAKQKKEYKKKNKEHLEACHKQWKKENREHIKKYNQGWKKENREHVSEYQKEYRTENKERLSTQEASHRRQNRDKYNENQRRRKKEDPIFAIHCNVRRTTKRVIERGFRRGSAVRDMGCTGEEAKKHLESLFDEHMTWENYGEYWHIDHIYPLAAANLKDRVEFLAAVNWRNLQPLEAKANMEKGDQVFPEAQELFNKLKKEFSKENSV